jgi:hypothetical protein
MKGKTPARTCQWCKTQQPRVSLVKDSICATTNDPAHWNKLLLDGWIIESTLALTDHVEITFRFLLTKSQLDNAFNDYCVHDPVIAQLHHKDVLNDL